MGLPLKQKVKMAERHYIWQLEEVMRQSSSCYWQKVLRSKARNQYGYRPIQPIHLAASRGFVAVVKLLLDYGAAIEAKSTLDGTEALYQAARSGHKAVVRLLLEHGAAIEATDQSGHRPIHTAAGRGHVAIVQMLLEKGAAIDAKDQYGYTPIHRAAEAGYEQSSYCCWSMELPSKQQLNLAADQYT